MRKQLELAFSVIIIYIVFILMISGCKPRPSVARTWGGMDLDGAVSKIAASLVEQGQLEGRPVLISPHDFYDVRSGLSLPLATLLREKMVAAMKKRGVRVLLPGVDEDRYMILQGTWQRQKDKISLNMKVMKLGAAGPEAVAAESVPVPIPEIDPQDLIPDRESWARYLVRTLELKSRDQDRRTVHIKNFNVSGKTGTTADLGGYLSDWLRTALAESRLFSPLDPQTEIKKLPLDTIRTRGTRAIRPEAVSLTADLLKADAELTGSVWLHKEKVEVHVRVSDLQDKKVKQVSAAMADIPSTLFPEELIKPKPQSPKPHIPPPLRPEYGHKISKGGLTLDLTTDRGERQPYYHLNDKIRFILRLNRIAYVYLFDLDAQGQATLLYPVDPNTGYLLKGVMPQVKPGEPLVLPADGASYELVVREPFGRDTVWAVASDASLDFPEDLAGDWSGSNILIDRIRKQGLFGKNGYAEAQVEIVTGP